MKITVLVENTSSCGLPAEHGLSLFVKAEYCSFLFDMGETDLFARNAQVLDIDLRSVDCAVLSHGHYDHGGGLKTFLSLNNHAPVYMSCHAFEPHFNEAGKDIGLDPALCNSKQIVFAENEKRIAPGLTLYSCSGTTDAEDFCSYGLTMMQENRLQTEDFRHEQYLLAEENGKRILFSGCSHRGILNIVNRFHPDILIGGFHLFKSPLDDRLAAVATALDRFQTVYYTCHCIGGPQYRFMADHMKDLHYISTGEQILL